MLPLPAPSALYPDIVLSRLLRLLNAVDRLIVRAERHPAGARYVLLLAGFGCFGIGLVVPYAALDLVRSAVGRRAGRQAGR